MEENNLPSDFPRENPQVPHHQAYLDGQIKTLLSWRSPARPYRKRGKQFFMTTILLAFLIEVVLFLFSQYILMLVVVSLVFLSFSFVLVPPSDSEYRISSEGIRVGDHFYLWQELYDFYFKRREGVDVLHIRTMDFFPGELTLTLGNLDRDHVRQVLLPYLPYREYIKPTFMERSADWLSKTFPLEPAH